MRREDMRRFSRMRRGFKGCGLALSLFILVTWILSLRWSLRYGVFDGIPWHIIIGAGRIRFLRWFGAFDGDWLTGWFLRETTESAFWSFHFVNDDDRFEFVIPFWIPFLLVAIPTAFLFWRDLRHPPGHCQKCGYDLTGNTSGICPECGERI